MVASTYESLAIKFAASDAFRHSVRGSSKLLDTMWGLSRRSFLAASAAFVAAPAVVRAQTAAEVDVAIIGAGAAGVAGRGGHAWGHRPLVFFVAGERQARR